MKTIKNFKDWESLNEELSYSAWLGTLAKKVGHLFTGGQSEPSSAPIQTTGEAPVQTRPEEKALSRDKESSASTQKSKETGSTQVEKTQASPFQKLDLSTDEGVKAYADACDAWIKARKPYFNSEEYHSLKDVDPSDKNPNKAAPTSEDYLTGRLFALLAQYYYKKTGIYVPWELAMAQCTLEGGFASNPKTEGGSVLKPIRTKNPFNIGNTDDGALRYFKLLYFGVKEYYKKMTESYLKNKPASALLQSEGFVNTQGNRYATSPDYEKNLTKLIDKINTTVA